MKKFLLLHIGFTTPKPEIIQSWDEWFTAIQDVNIKQAGLMQGREISKNGVIDLPWNLEAITGFNIIFAKDMEEAERIAQSNPYISSIRVYEIR